MGDDQHGKAEELVAFGPSAVSFELAAYQDSIGRLATGMDEVRQSMQLDGLSFEEARLQLCLSRMAEMNVDALGMPMDSKLFTFDQLRRGTTEVSGRQIEVTQAAPPARWRGCLRHRTCRFWGQREVPARRAALEGLENSDSSFSTAAFTWSLTSSLSPDGFQHSDSSSDSSPQSPDGQRSSFRSVSSPFTWSHSDRYR